jgi:hypothetical protein
LASSNSLPFSGITRIYNLSSACQRNVSSAKLRKIVIA